MDDGSHRSSRQILVIDDDRIMRDLVTDWLEDAGYSVLKAGDCRQASAALGEAPALVVCDMWMPGRCGTDAIRWIRQEHPGLQLIAISGNFGCAQGCTEQDAMAAGAARAFPKPVKRAQLLSAVAELIGPPGK